MVSLCTSLAQAQPLGTVRELVEKRTSTSKHWLRGDGSVTVEIHSRPIHYRDSEGVWRDIDTKIGASARLGYAYSVAKNSFRSHFAADATGWQAIEFDNRIVGFKANATGHSGREISDNAILYKDAWQGVDLKYQVLSSGIKEEMIIRQAPETTDFHFTIRPGLLRPVANGKAINFVDRDGNLKLIIPEPFMHDADGAYSDDIDVTWNAQADGSIDLTLTPDVEWLSTASYPVVVDPSFVPATGSGTASRDGVQTKLDHANPPNQPITTYSWSYTSTYLTAGKYVSGPDTRTMYSCVKWDTSSIPTGSIVQDTSFILLHQYTYGDKNKTIGLRKITGAWPTGNTPLSTESLFTQTWVGDTVDGDTFPSSSSNKATFQQMVQDWVKHPDQNYGAEFELAQTGNYLIQFWAAEGGTTNAPTLVVNYIPDNVPPYPGVASSPAYTDTASFDVSYTGASDNIPNGVDFVELWYKQGYSSEWMDSKLTSIPVNGGGSFSFTALTPGTYYFDLVAWDKAGNKSPDPVNLSTGDDSTVYDPMTAGTNRLSIEGTYLYPGGPLMSAALYNGNTLPRTALRTSSITRGAEGEPRAVSIDGVIVGSTSYNSLYRTKTVSDGKAQTTTYNYDNTVGNLLSVVYPGGDTAQFVEYDPVGNLLQQIAPNGDVTNFTYDEDPENQLTHIDVVRGTQTILSRDFTYDPVYGNLLTSTDPEGSVTYDYTDEGVIDSVTRAYTGLSPKTISYDFWADGSIKTITTPAGDSPTLTTYWADLQGLPTLQERVLAGITGMIAP